MIYFGGTGHTDYYTPSGTTAPGTWAAGPDLPTVNGVQQGISDGPGAELPDGTILLQTSMPDNFNGPSHFWIFNPTTNTYTPSAGAPAQDGGSYTGTTLDLPNGQVMFSGFGSTVYIYDPGTAPQAAAKPAITSLVPNADGTLLLTGTGLDGIDEGAVFGDDHQMATNFPIVRFTSSVGVVSYATTSNWSLGVATGATPQTATVTLPVGIAPGTYSVSVSANGVSSAPVSLSLSLTAGNAAPTLDTAASATPPAVAGTSTALSVLAADDGGESNLTYTWATTSAPAGAEYPSFSDNGDKTAKNMTATFHQAGSYTFRVTATDAGGLSVTSTDVPVTVAQTASSLALSPTIASLGGGATQQFNATENDQFGIALVVQPAIAWSLLSGAEASTPRASIRRRLPERSPSFRPRRIRSRGRPPSAWSPPLGRPPTLAGPASPAPLTMTGPPSPFPARAGTSPATTTSSITSTGN